MSCSEYRLENYENLEILQDIAKKLTSHRNESRNIQGDIHSSKEVWLWYRLMIIQLPIFLWNVWLKASEPTNGCNL